MVKENQVNPHPLLFPDPACRDSSAVTLCIYEATAPLFEARTTFDIASPLHDPFLLISLQPVPFKVRLTEAILTVACFPGNVLKYLSAIPI